MLRLAAKGLTTRQIADRLFISRKTAEHHVGNVLAKLGLPVTEEPGAGADNATAQVEIAYFFPSNQVYSR